MGKKIIFDYMNKDTVSTHVEIDVDSGTAVCTNYTDILHRKAFGREIVDLAAVKQFFRSRVFDEGRPDKDELLRAWGLRQYNPYDIVRVTHGVLTSDDSWIRFEGETLCYRDVCSEARRIWL